MGEGKRVIVNSAIIYSNGEVVAARRHSDVIALQAKCGIQTVSENSIQGFVDNSDHFYTRAEAMKLVLANGQLTKPTGEPELYSEDLWTSKLEGQD